MDPWVQLATAAFKRTPKTPLSFFCRLAWIVGGIVFGALYSNISIAQKEFAVGFALIFLAAEFVLILAFVWLRPEYLLYGADTHFERWKTTFDKTWNRHRGRQIMPPSITTTLYERRNRNRIFDALYRGEETRPRWNGHCPSGHRWRYGQTRRLEVAASSSGRRPEVCRAFQNRTVACAVHFAQEHLPRPRPP